jgi:hypothetical protein
VLDRVREEVVQNAAQHGAVPLHDRGGLVGDDLERDAALGGSPFHLLAGLAGEGAGVDRLGVQQELAFLELGDVEEVEDHLVHPPRRAFERRTRWTTDVIGLPLHRAPGCRAPRRAGSSGRGRGSA